MSYSNFPAGTYTLKAEINGADVGRAVLTTTLSGTNTVMLQNSLGITNGASIRIYIRDGAGNVTYSSTINNWDNL